jgi:hypothetical protein
MPLRLVLVVLLAVPVLVTLGCGHEVPKPDDDDTVTDDDDDTDDSLPDEPFGVQVVVTLDGAPMEGAWLLQGGGPPQAQTAADGTGVAVIDPDVEGELWLIAAAEDHRSTGFMVTRLPDGPIELELIEVETDNPDYLFQPAGVEEGETTLWCSHCHITFAAEFGASAHYEAARDEQVLDLFAGTAVAFGDEAACDDAGGSWRTGSEPGTGEPIERCYLGRGLLPDAGPDCGDEGQLSCDDPALPEPDRPDATGACADCHAPAIDGPAGGGHSLLDARGYAFEEGVTCDLCHKVRSVDLDAPDGGVGGRLVLGRPLEEGSATSIWRPVMYGPYADVVNGGMGGTWAPFFSGADLCSGCHEHSQAPLWDDPALTPDADRWPDGRLPVLSTWSEWTESVVSPGSVCQDCHMPASSAANAADVDLLGLEPGAVAGFPRSLGEVRDHSFYGPLDERPLGGRLLDTAGGVTLAAAINGDELELSATVTNFQTGHGLPTGKPLRRILMVLEATCDGAPLPQVDGRTITEVGGALARGVVGDDVTVEGATLTWNDLPGDLPDDGLILRAVRPTGDFIEYQGPGAFRDPAWTAQDKGLAETSPLGSVAVAQTDAATLELATALDLADGDVLFLGEAAGFPVEGAASAALAGAAGVDFAKVLIDADGQLQAPHYRAVDIVRDNRLLPYEAATSEHRFALPDGCVEVTAKAALVYRRYPLLLARERGWDAVDHVFFEAEETVDAR